jgi:hypothetical protein
MTRREYLNFDLTLEAVGDDAHRAAVTSSPAGETSTVFKIPFTPLEIENFLLRVGRPRRGVRRIDSPEMYAAQTFGSRLYETVFAGEVGTAYRRSLDAAEREGKGLRLRLRLTAAPDLGDLPWEYLYSEGLGDFLVLSDRRPMVRYPELPVSVRPLLVEPPLRILLLISAPSDFPALDAAAEEARLREALAGVIADGRAELRVLERATLSDLQRALRQEDVHVLHYIGHGGFDRANDEGVLVLEDDQGRGRMVSGRSLGTILHDHDPMRLLVLNACEGARTGTEDPFGGVAPELTRRGAPAVVAMQFEITDGAAIQFAREFYLALADGYPVDAAVSAARKAIFAGGNDIEWGTPVLYLRAPSGEVFEMAPTVATLPEPVPPEPLPIPPEPEPIPEPQPEPPPPGPEPEPEPVPPEPEPVPPEPELAPAVAQTLAIETTMQRALDAEATGDWREAVRHYAEVLGADPGRVDAAAALERAERRLLAEELLAEATDLQSQGRMAEASERWDRLESVAPDMVDDDLRREASASPTITEPPPEQPPHRVPPAPAPPRRRIGALLVGLALVAAAFIGFLLFNRGDEEGGGDTTLGGGEVNADAIAFRTGSPPTLDGNPAEWEQVPEFKAESRVFTGAGEPTLSFGRWKLAWDDQVLYVLVVTDDFEIHTFDRPPFALFNGDSAHFEFGPDPSGLGDGDPLRDADRHVLLGVPGPDDAQVLGAVNPVSGGAFVDGPDSSRQPSIQGVVNIEHGTGYILEAAIPWPVLGVNDPQPGMVFGVNLNVSDAAPNGDLRLMVSTNPNRSGENQDNPGVWNTLGLQG